MKTFLASKSRLHLFWYGVGIAALFFVLLKLRGYHWDFACLYAGSKALRMGHNPYTSVLRALFPEVPSLGFAFPPLFAYAVTPLTYLSWPTASFLYYFAKLATLGGLLILWNRHFLKWTDYTLAIPIFLLGYDGAFFWDLTS